jgi:hypothetical protein
VVVIGLDCFILIDTTNEKIGRNLTSPEPHF